MLFITVSRKTPRNAYSKQVFIANLNTNTPVPRYNPSLYMPDYDAVVYTTYNISNLQGLRVSLITKGQKHNKNL